MWRKACVAEDPIEVLRSLRLQAAGTMPRTSHDRSPGGERLIASRVIQSVEELETTGRGHKAEDIT